MNALGVVLEPVMGHDGAFLGKALYVLGFTAQERFGDEKREISVLMPGGLEHIVQLTLHLFPDGIAVRLDYHTPSYCRLLCKISLCYQLVIPLRIIIRTLREVLKFCCHIALKNRPLSQIDVKGFFVLLNLFSKVSKK